MIAFNMNKNIPEISENIYKHWIGLPADNIRAMLIALIGLDFGPEPEKRIPEIKESRKNFTNFIADKCKISKEDIVMDMGSGCGFGTYWLAQRAKHVHGCDISPAYLKFASNECASLDNVSFHEIKSREFDFLEKDTIDVVCSISVFIHLNLYDMYWYFKEFERIVKPGGRIWIDVADSENIDFKGPNVNGGYFLKHAKDYREDPSSLPGIMQWNSLKSVVNIADLFGFQSTCIETGGQLLFVKRSGTNSEGII